MGKEAKLKSERRQVRIVVKELIGEVLNAELVAALRKELGEKVDLGIKTLNKVLHERLEAIETRNKDLQSLIVRESTSKGAAPTQQIPLISMEPDSK